MTHVFISSTELPPCCLGSMATSCSNHCIWPGKGRGLPMLSQHGYAPAPALFYQPLPFCCSSVEAGGRPRRWEHNTSASIMTMFDAIFCSRGCQDELCLVWSISSTRGRYPQLPTLSLISNYAIACSLHDCLFTKHSFIVPSSSL